MRVHGFGASDEERQSGAEGRAGGNGKKTFPQPECEPGADGQDGSRREQHCGQGVNTDENKNSGYTHLADPIVETSKPLLDWQKLHGDEETDHDRGQYDEPANCTFRCILVVRSHLVEIALSPGKGSSHLRARV